jgi:hypothetical protein
VDLYAVQESGLTIPGAEVSGPLPGIAEDEFKASISLTGQEGLAWMRGSLDPSEPAPPHGAAFWRPPRKSATALSGCST